MRFITPTLLALLTTTTGWSADEVSIPRPKPEAQMLAVTTGGIANSLIRPYNPSDWESQVNKTYVQNYTSMLAVSKEGILYTNTT